MKYYTIYKITHKESGKFYIGRHVTENLDDGYMGSGKLVKYAQDKYGIEAFEKEYIAVFYDPYFMFLYEQTIVTEDFCKRKDTYNVAPGGFAGGWSYINSNELNYTDKHRISLKGNIKKYSHLGGAAGRGKTRNPTFGFKNKFHSAETKQKMSEIAKERLKDSTKNSQYGTMWITNGQESKKIKKDQDIPDGWRKGRKIK